MRPVLKFIFKVLLAAAILYIGTITLQDSSKNENRIVNNLENLFTKFKLPNDVLKTVKKYSNVLTYVEPFLLLLTGLSVLFGQKGAGFYFFLELCFNMALINNPFLYKDEKYLFNVAKFVSIYGGILLA